jgi:putative transcriptional regulator
MLNMTQKEFSMFGFSESAIKHWEQNRRTPEGAARVLLKVIEHHPGIVHDVLTGSDHPTDQSHA